MAQKQSNPFVELLSGSLGGMALVTVGYPFDTVKVRLQTSNKGLVECVSQTFKNEGLGGFFKGITSPIAGVSFVNATLFFTYNQCLDAIKSIRKNVTTDKYGTLPLDVYFVAGGLTGIPLSFVEGPVELVKSKMQVMTSNEGKMTTFKCAKMIVKDYGIRGVYQGLGATLLRNVPANAFYLLTYEYLKKTFRNQQDGSLSPLSVMTAGGLAGVAYWVSSYPFDVIKSLLQTDSMDKNQRKFGNSLDCAKHIYANKGIKGFFPGFVPCIARALPANAACFLTYEFVKGLLLKE